MEFSPQDGQCRAVSETLGYVLLIAVVFTSIGFIGAIGLPVVEEQQESEYMSNTVRAFEVFGTNLDAIERDQAPSRETEIQYQGGQMFQTEDFIMEITVSHDGEQDVHFLSGTPVTYEKGDSSVHYEAGSVIRQDSGNSIMRSSPAFQFDEERVQLSVITTTVADEQQVLSGSGKMSIIADKSGSQTHEIIRRDDSADDVEITITVESPRYDAWDLYFESEGLTRDSINHDSNEVTYTFQSEELMLRETLVLIEASS